MTHMIRAAGAAAFAALSLAACETYEAPANPTVTATDAWGVKTVEAGPIWNNDDAGTKCPAIAARLGGVWTGGWWTTRSTDMSVCQVSTPQIEAAREDRYTVMSAYAVKRGKPAEDGRCMANVFETHMAPDKYLELINFIDTTDGNFELGDEPGLWATSWPEALADLKACEQ